MLRKILIAEDNAINREMLCGILDKEYEVLEAANGQEALDIIHKKHRVLSAVLLDIVMPVMDGFEVLKAIRGNAVLSQIPVIVVTGSKDEDVEVKALSLGANDFITKPYNPALIRHCLRNTINLCETASIVNAIQRDKLTGLYNRETFFGKVESMLKLKKPGYYVMACFDIDSFKVINDQYGAAEGDRILQQIGKLSKETFEAVDGICSRISADNFAALYPAGEKDIEFVTLRRDKGVALPDSYSSISYSVGRYVVNDLTLSASAIYDRAYIAKQSVKGRYDKHVAYFSESMRDKLLREQAIIGEMNAALEAGHFEVWYQPQVNHITGALIGAEALVRWRHPEKGLITPDAYIPVFEQNGFIYEMDKCGWEQVCIFQRGLLDRGQSPLPVSINISRYDIFRADFLNVLKDLIDRYGLPIGLVHLEITESAFATSTEQIIAIVKELIEYGFTVEIDDFGSGYSSLNTLKDVPATVLKLDMRFLMGTGESQRVGNIVESVVRMAKWLGMSVIAEGVETKEQADYLKSIGCSYMQGFLYARPMPGFEYEALLVRAEKEERLLTLETVENLDNNSFWDPASMDTLVFNNYVSSACIFEYHDGEIELLRANDAYAEMVGHVGMTVEDAIRLDWANHLDAETQRSIRQALETSIRTGGSVTGEYVFRQLPGCPEETTLRSTMRVIATSGTHYLVYCMNENITAQRLAEKKERETAEYLQAIMDDAGSGITAAVITDGEVRFLLANDKYYELTGYTRAEYEKEVASVFDVLHPEDRQAVKETVMEAYRSETGARIEYRLIRKDGAVRWIRGVLSSTEFTGMEQPVQLAILTDITAEKDAEQVLHETDGQLRFLNEIAHDLLAQPDSEKGIEDVLTKLLMHFGGSRAYIFEFYDQQKTVDSTYEVCAEGVPPEKDHVPNVPHAMRKRWLQRLNELGYYHIADVDALNDDRPEKEMLRARGAKSLIAVPLRRDGALIGFVGIENHKESRLLTDRLVALGDYIAVMLTRRDLDKKIRSDNQMVLNLMNDTPGGFVRLKVLPGGESSVPIYCNDGFCSLVGMDRETIMQMYGEDSMAGVHPDDIKMVRDAERRMLTSGEAYSEEYRLRHGNGGYIRLMIFGRKTVNAAGEAFLNIYYTDASEKSRLDGKREELLENLPCGAGIYEVVGGEIRAVYLNKRYRAYLGREIGDLEVAPVFSVVHEDDRKKLSAAVRVVLEEGRETSCDVRIMDGKGGYILFRLVGSAMERGLCRNAIYVTFTPISEEEQSYSRMLPVALAAVIRSSEDLAYVKDRDHRYVCCSKSFISFLGKTDEAEIVGRTDEELIDFEYAARYRAEEDGIFASGQAKQNYEATIPTLDGSIRYANTSKYPLLDAGGSVIGVYGVTRDITQTRETFSQLKLLTDSIPGGLATYACTKDSIKIQYFNDGFCKLFGCTRETYAKISAANPVSMMFVEDRPVMDAQLASLIEHDTPIECTYRVHVSGGGYKWISHKAVAADRYGDTVIVNAVLLDITQIQEAAERLRISEEEHRLATQHSGNIICRFHVAERTATMSPEVARMFSLPENMTELPDGPVRRGEISPDSAEDYVALFSEIIDGKKSGVRTFQQKTEAGWRWLEARYSTIFSGSGEPVSAVISFTDVTEQLEKEAVYKKWQQSMRDKAPESYTLFRCNLSKDASYDTMEGNLLQLHFKEGAVSFDERTKEYADQCVYEEDRGRYASMLSSNTLLANYYRGKRTETLEYREKIADGGVRWLRLSIDLVEYPNSSDVEVFLMYENIDDTKREELLTIERAERDPLTGVYNRAAFAARVEKLIAASAPGAVHALLMLDIDGFKMVNDAFGHSAGDQTLIDIAGAVRSALRSGDLLGRLGGDEFVVFLNDIPTEAIAAMKAKQICSLTRKSFSVEVQISSSVGIAICPRDGKDFDTLYKKVDAALYYVKGSGKDNFAVYHDDMDNMHLSLAQHKPAVTSLDIRLRKRRMLIVDDSRIDYEYLSNLFKDEFIIDKAKDGNSALIRLRYYGSAISVVLLDLIMPDMDGFAVLEKMQASAELRSVPVVVVSAHDDREASLKAIRSGASDFVTKPVDPDVLRIRVQSAISRAENERLRAQNSFLELESNELIKYRTVLERTGTVLIEHDWIKGTFTYDPTISMHIAGVWDGRKLWRILLTDMVADASSVKEMQELVHKTAGDRSCMGSSMTVLLKTPEKGMHRFRMDIFKRVNAYQLTDKLIIALKDIQNAGGEGREGSNP